MGFVQVENRKIVPYHGSAHIPRLTVSVPDYGSWSCVEILRSCGINNLVEFRHPCALIRLQTTPTTKNIELGTGTFSLPKAPRLRPPTSGPHHKPPLQDPNLRSSTLDPSGPCPPPKSYRSEGQPWSTRSEFPSRAASRICRLSQHSGLCVNYIIWESMMIIQVRSYLPDMLRMACRE